MDILSERTEPSLGFWVGTQRVQFNKSKLSKKELNYLMILISYGIQ